MRATSSLLCSFLVPAAVMAAFTVPAMRLDESLSGKPALAVEGRQGWQIKQMIRFGEFSAGPVKRGWTRGYDWPFVVRFTGAREKLAFEITDGAGARLPVLCAGKLSEQDLHRWPRGVDINLRTRDAFSCAVRGVGEGDYEWVVADLNQNRTSGEVSGSLIGPDLALSFRPVWHLANGKKTWDTRPLGIELLSDGHVVAAVETVNEGRVWLGDALSGEQRLVVAAALSALLLRSDLAEHND